MKSKIQRLTLTNTDELVSLTVFSQPRQWQQDYLGAGGESVRLK